jgi:lysophospholipase L1-like esterase
MEAAGGPRAFLDGLHPNSLGNSVMAQQAAKRLIEWQRSVEPLARPRLALVR